MFLNIFPSNLKDLGIMEKQKPIKLIATLIISIISISVAAYFAAYFVGYSVWVIITGIVILVFVIFSHQYRRIIEFRAPVVPDKYRVYLAVLLTIVSFLSILPLSHKVVE
jgi:predicted tellurium resistance membrane protein TerC